MTKPTDIFEWASDSSALKTPPSSGKQQTGYAFREKPSRGILNWLLNVLGLWLAFLNTRFNTSGALTLGANNGNIALVADPPNTGAGLLHVYEHVATGSGVASRFQADSLRGKNQIALGDAASFEPQVDDDGLLSVVRHVCSGAGDTQIQSGSIAPLDSIPAHLNRNQALALGNLVKVAGAIRISWDGSGNPSIVSTSGYNLTGASLAGAAGDFIAGLTVALNDDFAPACVFAQAEGVTLAATLQGIFNVNVAVLGSSPRLRVTLCYFSGGVWENALVVGATPLANSTLDLNITAF